MTKVGWLMPGGSSRAFRECQVMKNSERDGKVRSRIHVSGLSFALKNDADLRAVVERWGDLSLELRRAIVRMVMWD